MDFIEFVNNRIKDQFNEEDKKRIIELVSHAVNDFNTSLADKKQQERDNKNQSLNDILAKLTEKPEILPSIISSFKGDKWPSFYIKIIISLIVIIPITFLSYNGILGTCETSTLFGGIVGYLLGELS